MLPPRGRARLRSTGPAGTATFRGVAAPSTFQALTRGAHATGRSAWLVAPALIVSLLRAALAWPAPLFAVAVARLGILDRVAAGVASGPAVLDGALAALTAPRTICVIAGLWAAGLLTSAALRVAFLSGALPTLGEVLAGRVAPRPRFAEGLAFGFAPLLGTALLGFIFELAAQAVASGAVLTAAFVALHRPGGFEAIWPALLGASTLVLAVVLLLVASLSTDAALARTALLGERAVRALGHALCRVLARPGAFFFAALALGVASVAVVGSAKAFEAAVLGLGEGAPLLLVVGPRLMVATLGAGLSALLELWRLASIAALACADEA